VAPLISIGQTAEESPLKFAFYSPSWGGRSGLNLLAGLRLVVDNQTSTQIRLESIEFQADVENTTPRRVAINLDVEARNLAEKELTYTDLLSLNQCVTRTLEGSWRLVEISNYTLNPSVRRLIIEDTSAFRIYQCVSSVRTSWVDTRTGQRTVRDEWVLYHFESKPDG
jgi:hypothetical protein